MIKTIKKYSANALFILAFSGIVISGCKKSGENSEPNESIKDSKTEAIHNVNGRLQFASTKALNQTLESLRNKETDYLKNWENQQGFKSLRSSPAEEGGLLSSFGFPQHYAAVINEKGEYMVGDTIVWFNKGLKHMIPGNDEAKLAKVKQNPATSEISFQAGATTLNRNLSTKSGSTITMGVDLGNGNGDARYQKEFRHDNDPGSIRKIIFEIQNYVEDAGKFGKLHMLYTRIKQEYKGSQWRPAGETMEKWISNGTYTITYNSTFNNALLYQSGSIPYAPQTDGNNLQYAFPTVYSASGTIKADVTGDYHARVTVPGYSQGIWDVRATW
ncbi:hypothetical protein H7F33_19430 [Pedobacter sp. PAMC26386]|nr:hypothetical protein H7F33_19430 [Pedobacter sp. PAMC26386]